MLNLIIGALLGILLYRFFSRLYGPSVPTTLLKVSEFYCLQLLISAHDDLVFLKETKAKTMKDLNLTENQIKIAKNIEEARINRWKHDSIQQLLLRYPASFLTTVEYHDWNSAMSYLEKIIKRLDKPS
jgi:hypothetical protein